MKTNIQNIGLILASLTLPASAVIVAGASGGGNTPNNTTAAQFQSEYGISFPAYDNVIRYSDASGIYLGYDAATKDVWVLTARHVSSSLTQGATVTIDGLVYNRQPNGADGFGLLPGGDLRLVRYNRGDLAVPTLPAVNISTSIPTAGTGLFMAGYGQNRTQNATLNGSTSDAVSVTVGTEHCDQLLAGRRHFDPRAGRPRTGVSCWPGNFLETPPFTRLSCAPRRDAA